MSTGPKVRSRVKTSVEKSEGEARRVPQDQRSRAFWNPGILDAIVTTAITAASLSGGNILYGNGQVQIVINDPSNPNISMIHPAYPSPVDVRSISTTTAGIPLGQFVTVGWYNGEWRIVNVDCGN